MIFYILHAREHRNKDSYIFRKKEKKSLLVTEFLPWIINFIDNGECFHLIFLITILYRCIDPCSSLISTRQCGSVNWYLFCVHFLKDIYCFNRLCGLVVRVPGFRSRGSGSVPGAARFSEKLRVWNGVHSASWG
jgi:hypothetical protein